jgi:hypothetical protein
MKSRDRAVGIAIGYGLDDGEVGVRVSVRAKFFSIPRRPDVSEAHPASYPMGNGALSPGLKRPRREADHPHPTSAEVKNTLIYKSSQ